MEEKREQYNRLAAELENTPKEDIYNRKRIHELMVQKYLELLYSNPAGF